MVATVNAKYWKQHNQIILMFVSLCLGTAITSFAVGFVIGFGASQFPQLQVLKK